MEERIDEKGTEEKLRVFIENLVSLGGQLSAIFKSGRMDIKALEAMNATIENMAKAQSGCDIEEFSIVEEDAKSIYYNFNAIVQMIESQESRFMDAATMKAVNVFLKNINTSTVNIAAAYGLV